MKFSGYLDLSGIESNLGGYLIDEQYDYFNKAAMVVDTMMKAGLSCFDKAESYLKRKCFERADEAIKSGCSIMNTLFAWREIQTKRPPNCAKSWLDDAWCTLHQAYEELREKEEEF